MNKNQDDDCPLCANLAASGAEVAEVDLLDLYCDQVEEMIEEKEWEEAEGLARMILELFPGEVAGLERLALVYEARRNFAKAKQYLRKALAFMRSEPGYTEAMREDMRSRLRNVKQEEERSSKASWH